MTARVQNAGLARYATAIAALSHWIGWGTGSAAAASAADVTPAGEARQAASLSTVTTTATGDTVQMTATLTASATRAITEVGAFDALSAGNMDVYADFTSVGLSTNDSIAFTIKVQLQ